MQVNLFQQMESDSLISELAVELLDADATRARLEFKVEQTAPDTLKVRFASDVSGNIDGSPELFNAMAQLIEAHRASGTGLIGAVYEFEKNPDGSWGVHHAYEYGEPDPHFFAARAQRPPAGFDGAADDSGADPEDGRDLSDLLRQFTFEQYEHALQTWMWIGLEDKAPVFASPFGDIFLDSEDGVWLLDIVDGKLNQLWADLDECVSALNTAAGQQDWLRADLTTAALSKGLRPKSSQILDLAVPAAVGGELTVDNVHVMDFVTAVGMAGQLHDQLRFVPEGATIRIAVQEEPKRGWRRWLPSKRT